MTVIRPNSVSGINSITAQANEIKIFKSDGTQGGLVIGGANLNATSGISTVAALTVTGNVSVGGTLTYQDVTNIDSVGIVTSRNIVFSGSTGTAGQFVIRRDSDGANIGQFRSDAGTNDISIGNGGSGSLILKTGANTERLRITAAGDMGLGATPAFSNGSGFEVARSGTACIRIEGNSGNHALEAYADSSGATLDARGSSANLMFDIGGSEKLRIDSSGRLLVGTTSADSNTRLHVSAAENTSDPMATDASIVIANTQNAGNNEAAALKFNLGNTNTASISAHYDTFSAGVNSSLRFYTQYQSGFNSPSERLRILSDGKVAIGGVTANSQLDVHGGDGISITHSGDTFLQSRTTGTTGTNYLEFKDSGGGAGAISYHHNGDSMRFKINGSERARIDSDGHLQIRREGVAGVSGTDSRHTRFIVKQTNNQEAILGSVFAQGKSSWGGDLVFASKSANGNPGSGLTERMRLLSHGSLRVSTDKTDSDYAQNSTDYWHVFHHHVNNQAAFIIEHSGNTNPYGLAIDLSNASPDNNSNYFLACFDSSVDRLKIFSDGDIDNHDNSYSGFSDVKLKQDIVDAGSQWDDIKNLRVRKFKFKSDVAAYGDEAKTLIGVVAQETELVSPGLVKDNPDVDKNNNDLGTTTKSVRYSVLYMKAVKALQEAQTRIETLEAAVRALQGS